MPALGIGADVPRPVEGNAAGGGLPPPFPASEIPSLIQAARRPRGDWIGLDEKVIEEARALPLIVDQGIHQIGRGLPLQVMDAGDAALRPSAGLGCGATDGIMIRLGTTGEGIEEVDLLSEIGPLNKPTTAVRLHLGRKTLAVNPDFFAPIAIEICRLDLDRLATADRCLGPGKMTPDLVPQMRKVESAEYPMPVPIIALCGEEFMPHWTDPAPGREQTAEGQTLLVGPVSLGIADQEVLPMSPSDVGGVSIGIGAEPGLDLRKPPPPFVAEGPLLHLAIRTGGQIAEPSGAKAIQCLTGGLRDDPVGRPLEQIQEALQPPVLVHPPGGTGPATELLAVVGSDGQPPSGLHDPAQVILDLSRWAERDQVPERFIDREDSDRPSIRFGQVVVMQSIRQKPGSEKGPVIN